MPERVMVNGLGSINHGRRPLTRAEARWHGQPHQRERLYGPTPYLSPWEKLLRSNEARGEAARGDHGGRQQRDSRRRGQIEQRGD